MSGNSRGFGDIKHVPVWAHHGTEDANVSVEDSRYYISKYEATGLTTMYAEEMSDSEIQEAIDNHARLFCSEYVGATHWVHRYAYDNYYLYEWLKKQRRPLIRPFNSSIAGIFKPEADSVPFTTRFSNPHNLSYADQLIAENFDQVQFASIPLYDDGLHGDRLAQDSIWGNILPPFEIEDRFRLGVQNDNTAPEDTFYFHDLATFTASGPVAHEQHIATLIGPLVDLSVSLTNHGLQDTVRAIVNFS